MLPAQAYQAIRVVLRADRSAAAPTGGRTRADRIVATVTR